MDPQFTAGKSMGWFLKTNILKFGFFKNVFFMYSFKTVKMYSIFLTGIYYNSYVTSFLNSMRSKTPYSINTRIDAARSFMKLSSENKLSYFSTKNCAGVASITTQVADEGVYDLNSSNKTQSLARQNTNSTLIDDFGGTSEDVLEVTLNDLNEFKDEVVEDFVSGILGGVEKAALKYIDQTFREQDVHRALVDVLNTSIKEKEFIQESREYGINVMNDVVKDKTFLKKTKKLSLDVVQQEKVKLASIGLLKNCVNHRTMQHFGKILMRDAVSKTDAQDVLRDTITKAVIKGVQNPATNGVLGTLFRTVVSIDEVQKEAKNSLIYTNFKQKMALSNKVIPGSTFELSSALEQRIDVWIRERQTL